MSDSPRLRLAAALTVLALLPALCACGGDDAASSATAAASLPPAHYLGASALERDLANGFRHGLYRLAVMSQPPDDAADLDQQLPTGRVKRVRCATDAVRPTVASPWRWQCGVRWQTAAGAARAMRYDVRLLPTGCFAAGATPRLPAHRDTTIASFSEHPLNALVSVRRGC